MMVEEAEARATDADAHYRQGQECARLGTMNMPLPNTPRPSNCHPTHLKAIFGRGLALQRMGKAESAIVDFTTAIEKGGKWAEAYYSRALAHAALDHRAEALADYNVAIQKKPDYTDAFYGRAGVLKKLGQIGAALDDLNHVLASDPSYSEARHTRATIHYFSGDWQRAIDDFDAFLASQQHFGAYLLRGLAHHQLGRERVSYCRFEFGHRVAA